MKRLSVIALVFAVFAANAAYDYSWEYEDVNDKAESDWTEVAVGYNKAVAGVAVKIVGLKPGLIIFVR